ncbi:MAG: MATE family efflux transporter [Bacilli bacterium]
MSASNHSVQITSAPILKVLSALSIPLIGSSILQFLYNMIDMFWVGKLGSGAVASVGTITFLIGFAYAIQSFVIVGSGVEISQSIGQGKMEKAKIFGTAGLMWNGFLGSLTILFFLILGKQWISFFQLQDNTLEKDAWLYLVVCIPAVICSYFNVYFARVWASYGNTRMALQISAIGIVINILLDPLFIYGLNWGVAGAAAATVIGNVVVLAVFYWRSKQLFTKPKNVTTTHMKSIAAQGLPMSSQRILFMGVNIVLAKFIATYGADAIAAQRIGLQIESIAYLVIGGIGGAVSSFVGQNYGAKQWDRIEKGYKIALLLGFSYTALLMVVFLGIPEQIVRIFVDDPNTIAIGGDYLRIVGLSLMFATAEMISNGFFTGIRKGSVAATISITFTVLRIPLAIFLMQQFGINGLWWSIAISSMVKGILAVVFFKMEWRRLIHVRAIKESK